MNHKWKGDLCINCGIVRQKMEYKKVQRNELVIRNGIWYDKPIYTYGIAWYYGIPKHVGLLVKVIGFERPECKKQKLTEKQIDSLQP